MLLSRPIPPPQVIAGCRKPDSRIFQGAIWSVSRPDLVSRRAMELVGHDKALLKSCFWERSLALAASRHSHL
jgi:hypothetical protein